MQAQVTSQGHEKSGNEKYTDSNSTKFQLKAGPGFSTLSYDGTSTNKDNRSGLFLGAEFEAPLAHVVSIQTGVDYSQKGMKQTSTVLGTSFDNTIALNYLEIPLLLKLSMPLSDAFIITAAAGPYVGYALSRSASTTVTNGSAAAGAEQDVSSTYSKWDYGARFAAGFEIPVMSSMAFLLGAEYDLGVKDIATPVNQSAIRTRNLAADVGISLRM